MNVLRFGGFLCFVSERNELIKTPRYVRLQYHDSKELRGQKPQYTDMAKLSKRILVYKGGGKYRATLHHSWMSKGEAGYRESGSIIWGQIRVCTLIWHMSHIHIRDFCIWDRHTSGSISAHRYGNLCLAYLSVTRVYSVYLGDERGYDCVYIYICCDVINHPRPHGGLQCAMSRPSAISSFNKLIRAKTSWRGAGVS